MSAGTVAPMGGVRAIKRRKIRKILHVTVTVMLIAATLLFAIFRTQNVFVRFWQSIQDLILSLIFYFSELFGGRYVVATPVSEFPAEQMQALLPLSVEEFVAYAERFWSLFTNAANIRAFGDHLLDSLATFAQYLLPILILIAAFVLIIFLTYRQIDTAEEGPTKPLAHFLKVKHAVYIPIKKEVKRYVSFLGEHKKLWCWVFGLLWGYNLNLLTIVVETAAFIFYLGPSVDYGNILIQLVKFIVDFSVPIFFFPVWVWVCIVYAIIHGIRIKAAKNIREGYVKKDEEWIEKHPGALFFGGKQRSKKTSILTACKQIFERRFRKKAEEKFKKRDKQFPFFNWLKLQKVVRDCRARRMFIKLADIDLFVARLQAIYELEDEERYERNRVLFLERYGYDINDFDEYASNYTLVYNNGITEISIYDAIRNYAKLFQIYRQPTPLDVSAHSIREDFSFIDHGAFPIFDGDFFKDVKTSKKHEQYSHNIKWDLFRLGEVFDKNSAYDTVLEYGIGCAPEIAKERKNKTTKALAINKDKEGPNQNNDFFELDTKIRGQLSTIDNFDFWVWLFDDQRFDSLGADNKDLTTMCLIKSTTPEKFFLPFFTVEELVIKFIEKVYNKIYDYIANRKSKQTLLMYLLNCICSPLFHWYDRLRNQFSVYVATLKTSDGADGEVLNDAEKFYVVTAMTYKNVFATDYCRAFYDLKYVNAKNSLNDMPQYGGLYPTIEEFAAQNSYFANDMMYAFGERKKQEKGPEKKGRKTKTAEHKIE